MSNVGQKPASGAKQKPPRKKKSTLVLVAIVGVLLAVAVAIGAAVFINYYSIYSSLQDNHDSSPDGPVMLKPILYLYPEEASAVTVEFSHPELLTTTYPKYQDGWQVTAHPDGSLYDAAGKYYYGLYWEDVASRPIDFSEGFYVEGVAAADFLEEKLATIGLTDRERDEFIMYWLPVLEENGQSLVRFMLNDEIDYNIPTINPAPDAFLRLRIAVKKVSAPVSLAPQALPSFTRHGFTAVEWGGIIVE